MDQFHNPSAKSVRADNEAWREVVLKYQKPSTWRALLQIFDTLLPIAALWYLMYWSLNVSWWFIPPLAILTGAFMIRVFIIFHDCGHGSYFKSRAANDAVGFISGILAFTPYYHWRWEHAIHHGSAGDLDRRGTGDVWTLTVQEYLESSRWKKFAYRLARNPFILFVIAPLYLFLIRQRFCSPKASKRERHSVYAMNAAILGMALALTYVFGWKAYLMIQLIIVMIAGGAGVWLFYVQHQFEGVYWERGEDWSFVEAALRGSSFYKLPKILQWFSGNIGFHHIHHLSSRIPNYNLEECHKADPLFQQVKPVTLFSSIKSFSFRLWDEERHRLVGYRHLRERRGTKQ